MSDRTADFMARLAAGRPLILDGAMGTELERRGIPVDVLAWSARAMADHCEEVRQVHEDFIAAGAEIHIVNSFALGRPVLEPAGLGAHFENFNRRAVTLCQAAIAAKGGGRRHWIAGSISSFAAHSDRSRLPTGEALLACYREQVEILTTAGVDLLALEMLCDFDISHAALLAAAKSGLPVMAGFTCKWDADGRGVETRAKATNLPPQRFEDLLPRLLAGVPAGTPLIPAIMHCDFDVTDAALEILARHWSGPVAVYPNSGRFDKLHLDFASVASPEAFAAAARPWIESGAAIVGGCCGLGPEHIAALTAYVERQPAS